MARMKIERVSQEKIVPLGVLGMGYTFEYKGMFCIKTNRLDEYGRRMCVILMDGCTFTLDENKMVVPTKATIEYETMRRTKQ